jgi:hypothetical protein
VRVVAWADFRTERGDRSALIVAWADFRTERGNRSAKGVIVVGTNSTAVKMSAILVQVVKLVSQML